MKLLNYISVFIIFLLFNIQLYNATIQGFVTDSRTGQPLIGANILLLYTKTGAATDNKGFYIIKNVLPGRYIVRCAYLGYKDHFDTINIANQDEVLELNIIINSPIVDLASISTPHIEAYHQRLQKINKIKPVMLIHIDSLTYKDDYLTAYLSMKNQADDSIYLFKDYLCFNVLKPVITDSTGKLIKSNGVIDCIGVKTCPDSSDLILLKPGKTVKYPATKLEFYNFKYFPKGKYSIKIKYEFRKPEEINTFWCRGYSIKLLIIGLRGGYISSNVLTFINQ